MPSVICQHYCKDCYASNICALDAIVEQGDTMLLDTTRCIGCGACRTACVAFGSSIIKPKMIKPPRVKPLPRPPGSPWSLEKPQS